ncbi:MAG: porin [Planctomycetes bacterium]|nr:porin [Planctomycetota bacterium]
MTGRFPVLSLPTLLALAATAAAQDAAPTLEERVKALEQQQKSGSGTALNVLWKDGLRLESADKSFELKIGGRMQLDAFFGDADDDAVSTIGGPLEDGTQLRRARLAIGGKVQRHFDFKWEYDFSDKDSKAKVADVYAGIVDVDGVPNLRLGHFKEPFGLEALVTANETTFMERALPAALAPFRNTGLQLSESFGNDRATWAVGLFRETNDNSFMQSDGAWAGTARITHLPWATEKLDHLVHLGLAASRRAPPADELQYKSKPEANLALDFLDTTKLTDVDSVTLLGAELAVLLDRFSLQGEWVRSEVARGAGNDDATFSGWYAQAAWTLTGEPRRYRAAEATLGTPKPAKSLFQDGGCGAWEVAARVSSLDLDDGGVTGGELSDCTLALNWYPSTFTRVMLNLIRADLDRAPDDGKASIVEMRFQFAF